MNETKQTECLYCGVMVRAMSEEERPPAINDDSAWEALAADHAPDCDWVRTRAHRI